MNTTEPLPTSPDAMPFGYFCDNPNGLRNLLLTLHTYSYVDLHWERDWETGRHTGETEGYWNMALSTAHGKRLAASHRNIENVLWYVTTLAEAADSEAWQKQESDRKAALAKLTPDDRRLLGV